MTTGSRERGANLSTRYSGIFAKDGSIGSSPSLSDVGIQHPEAALIIIGEPGRGDGLAGFPLEQTV